MSYLSRARAEQPSRISTLFWELLRHSRWVVAATVLPLIGLGSLLWGASNWWTAATLRSAPVTTAKVIGAEEERPRSGGPALRQRLHVEVKDPVGASHREWIDVSRDRWIAVMRGAQIAPGATFEVHYLWNPPRFAAAGDDTPASEARTTCLFGAVLLGIGLAAAHRGIKALRRGRRRTRADAESDAPDDEDDPPPPRADRRRRRSR